MPFFIISLIIQIALVVHIVKTGRNNMWIWIVVMLPLAGTIAYFLIEILPEITGSRAARKVKRGIAGAVNPNKDIKNAARDFSVSGTVENTARLAEEMLNKGMYKDAGELYQSVLKGIYEKDPHLMSGLAKAEFGLNNYSSVKRILDSLIEHNPFYKNADDHLLYARTLEELNDVDGAIKEYEVLDGYYSGPQASYRYAVLLKNNGNHEKSRYLFEKIIHEANTAGKHYNSLYREWIVSAKGELGS